MKYLCILLLCLVDFSSAVSRQHEHGDRAHRLLIRGTASKCRRVCTYRVDSKHRFNVTKLAPEYCSHLVLSSADIELSGEVLISDALYKAIEDYKKWNQLRKPALILSVGADSSEQIWRRVVQSSAIRSRLVSRLAHLYNSLDVDGIEIAWVNGVVTNRDAFAKLFNDLRRHASFPEYAILTAVITADSTTKDGYDVSLLKTTTSFLIIEGSRIQRHETVATKGVQRPEPKGSVESLALEWEASGFPKSKLVIGYSVAVPISLDGTDVCTVKNTTTVPSASPIKIRGIGGRAFAVGAVAKEGAPIDGIGTMKERTMWASQNKFGGIALRGIENDHSHCENESAFMLLKSIAETQIC